METLLQILWFLGIDVSKGLLVAHLTSASSAKQERLSVSNDAKGIEELLAWLGNRRLNCKAVMEATSRYHRPCERALLNANVRVDLLNPRRARSLAIGLGIADKDDRVDAKVLAKAAQMIEQEQIKVQTLEAQDLKDYSRTIDSIKEQAAVFLKQMDGLDPDSKAYAAYREAARELKKIAAQHEKEWLEELKKDAETLRRYTLAKSISSVGHVTARIASVELPANLNERSLRKMCAYAGVVPRRNQSGTKELPDHIYGGNVHLRTGLFMAAMHSVYFGKTNQAFYEALKARSGIPSKNKGAAHLTAMVAVMHKLLRNIVAVIKRDSPWTPEPPKYKGALPTVQAVGTP
jgi:transposase